MNRIHKTKLTFLTVLTLCMTLGGVAIAQSAFFYQSPGSVGGKPANQIGALWETWALTQPAPVNPLTDTTGAHCAQGQPGYTGNPATNIWWLAGTNGGAVTRTCTVPLTRTLVFPIVNAAYFSTPDDTTATSNAGIADAKATAAAATNLSVTFDGQPLANPKSYLVTSAPFKVVLPADNIFGADAGLVLNPSVDSGYYVGITLYVPGQHTLKFKGTVGGQTIDVTYKLNVKFTPF